MRNRENAIIELGVPVVSVQIRENGRDITASRFSGVCTVHEYTDEQKSDLLSRLDARLALLTCKAGVLFAEISEPDVLSNGAWNYIPIRIAADKGLKEEAYRAAEMLKGPCRSSVLTKNGKYRTTLGCPVSLLRTVYWRDCENRNVRVRIHWGNVPEDENTVYDVPVPGTQKGFIAEGVRAALKDAGFGADGCSFGFSEKTGNVSALTVKLPDAEFPDGMQRQADSETWETDYRRYARNISVSLGSYIRDNFPCPQPGEESFACEPMPMWAEIPNAF